MTHKAHTGAIRLLMKNIRTFVRNNCQMKTISTPFIYEQLFNAPIEQVWEALTNKDKMKVWYFPQIEKFEPVIGYEFEFIDDGSNYKKEWKVTDVAAGHRLAHTWVYKGCPGSSEVTFELFKEGDKTRLKLTHIGLESFPNNPHFARHRFEDGWKQIIGSNLKIYLGNNA